MKKTFEFTEQEAELLRKEQYKYLINDNMDHFLFLVQQIVSERITKEPETIKPYHEHGNSVASDRTEPGQSAEDVLKGLLNRGMYEFSYSANECLQAMHTYASQVCADKDAKIKFWIDGWNHLSRMYDQSQSELDRLNESMTVMVIKNDELLEQIERFKNPLKTK